MVIFTQILFIVLSFIFKFPNEFNIYIRIILGLTLLLIILYRPNFINKNGSKISFGFLFNRNDFSADIKEVDFNFHFFTSLYFKNKTADIVEFSNIMGVSKDILFKYMYFTYSMSFDELVNKARIEYFVEIIKEPKYKNYTIEALAMEIGYNSRQRFYQPFKKYHGGNPSDLIDIY
jgi:AraC-like DNA-binding protein